MSKNKIIFKYIALLFFGSVVIAAITDLIFPACIAQSISFLIALLYGGHLAIEAYEEIEECEVEDGR